MTDWLNDRLTDWLIDWLMVWLIYWLFDWLIDCLIDWFWLFVKRTGMLTPNKWFWSINFNWFLIDFLCRFRTDRGSDIHGQTPMSHRFQVEEGYVQQETDTESRAECIQEAFKKGQELKKTGNSPRHCQRASGVGKVWLHKTCRFEVRWLENK